MTKNPTITTAFTEQEVAIMRTVLKFKDNERKELKTWKEEKELVALETWREIKKGFDVVNETTVKFKKCELGLGTENKALLLDCIKNFGGREVEVLEVKNDLTAKLK